MSVQPDRHGPAPSGTPALASGFPDRALPVLSSVSRRKAEEATAWAGRGFWSKESAYRFEALAYSIRDSRWRREGRHDGVRE